MIYDYEQIISIQNKIIESKFVNAKIINSVEKIPKKQWKVKWSSNTLFRSAICCEFKGGEVIDIVNNGEMHYFDVFIFKDGYKNTMIEYVDSEIIRSIFFELMRELCSDEIKEVLKYEESKLKILPKNILDNLFRADYKYAEKCIEYGTTLDSEFIGRNSKQHKYHNIDYFNTLNLGDKGFVLIEFDSFLNGFKKNIFTINECEIVLKDEQRKIIIFKMVDYYHIHYHRDVLKINNLE